MLLVIEIFKKRMQDRVLQMKLVCTHSFTSMPEYFSINIQKGEFHLDECLAKWKMDHC